MQIMIICCRGIPHVLPLYNLFIYPAHHCVLYSNYAQVFLLYFSKPLYVFAGMNAAVRAVVRMGLYVGAKVYFIHEVSPQIYRHTF